MPVGAAASAHRNTAIPGGWRGTCATGTSIPQTHWRCTACGSACVTVSGWRTSPARRLDRSEFGRGLTPEPGAERGHMIEGQVSDFRNLALSLIFLSG